MTAVARILEDTVAALCPDIVVELEQAPAPTHKETDLWRTLLTCVLSSQVPYTVAIAAAEVSMATLDDNQAEEPLGERMSKALSKPLACGRRYRFPQLRARQIAATWTRFTERGLTLSDMVASTMPDRSLRQTLMSLVDGLGPKQASMFLRDVGRSMDLAVLDRHVLMFMDRLGLASLPVGRGIGFADYIRREDIFRKFARRLGHSVGCVDRAVWVTMRVAREEKLL